MNKKAVVCAIMAMSLATGGLAFGQDSGNRNGRDEQMQRGDHQDHRAEQMQRGDRQDHRDERMQRSDHQDRRDEQMQRGDHQDRRDNNDARWDGHGAGPHREFHRGDRLPSEYRNRQYVVDDWRGHRLSRPPRGYHWVQAGSDYVLVAIGSGIILQLFLNN